MELLDGTELSQKKLLELRAQVVDLGFVPSLAVILVGDDPASHTYVKLKEKAAKDLGMDFHKYFLESDATQEMVEETVAFLSNDSDIDGILVQMPLPEHLDANSIIQKMGAKKDVDGFCAENLEKFIAGDGEVIWPVFPKALIALAELGLTKEGLTLEGQKAALISKSDIFTSAMEAACQRVGIDVVHIACDDKAGQKELIKSRDIIFSACGEAQYLDADYIKTGAMIIDGGFSELEGCISGDVDIEAALEHAAYLTPVPGGVGPMTIACLLENVIEIAKRKNTT